MKLYAGQTRRIQLDVTSWIDHIPGWLGREHAEQLLAKLVANAAWEQRDRWMVNGRVIEPRLTAEYTDLADAPDPAVREEADVRSAHYQVPYDGLWINFYRDNRDSTGWHGDWPTCKRPECIVPVLNLGAPRRFLIKPRPGGKSIGLTPESGDLIVMGGHAISSRVAERQPGQVREDHPDGRAPAGPPRSASRPAGRRRRPAARRRRSSGGPTSMTVLAGSMAAEKLARQARSFAFRAAPACQSRA